MEWAGNDASPFLRVNRSSCAAATIFPSCINAAAESWKYADIPRMFFATSDYPNLTDILSKIF